MVPYTILTTWLLLSGTFDRWADVTEPTVEVPATNHGIDSPELVRSSHAGLEALMDWGEVEFDEDGNIIEN